MHCILLNCTKHFIPSILLNILFQAFYTKLFIPSIFTLPFILISLYKALYSMHLCMVQKHLKNTVCGKGKY